MESTESKKTWPPWIFDARTAAVWSDAALRPDWPAPGGSEEHLAWKNIYLEKICRKEHRGAGKYTSSTFPKNQIYKNLNLYLYMLLENAFRHCILFKQLYVTDLFHDGIPRSFLLLDSSSKSPEASNFERRATVDLPLLCHSSWTLKSCKLSESGVWLILLFGKSGMFCWKLKLLRTPDSTEGLAF